MIRVPEVRVVSADGQQLGVMATTVALDMAGESGLDLVEVAPQAKPPVCRLMDYGKYKYETSKKARDAKKRQTVIHVKEVKFRVKTEEHDFQFKLRNIRKFLTSGDKVKVYVMFRGREITHTEFGSDKLTRVSEELKDIATVENRPKLEGRAMTMLLAPAHQK